MDISRIVKEKMESKKDHEHYVNDDKTEYPKEDMEDFVKQPVKNFISIY